jgi:antitoxin (DNA-binding transcriptional repressor) of toxin-antitoxin stability system
MEYKKINLRNLRHNLTQVKDSLKAGQAYEVLERGKSIGYLVPAHYNINLEKEDIKKKKYQIALEELVGAAELTEEEKKNFDPDAIYRKAMEDKHLK